MRGITGERNHDEQVLVHKKKTKNRRFKVLRKERWPLKHKRNGRKLRKPEERGCPEIKQ